MSDASNSHYQATDGLVPGQVTLILFSEVGTVMAEIIGPAGCHDAVEPMPVALTTACCRSPSPGSLFVLDDEELWQPSWGMLHR